MVEPSSLADTVTPPSFSPVAEVIAPLKIWSAEGELKTTFASHYTRTVSLPEALQLDNLRTYAKRATGEKYLINPNKA